MANDLFGGLGGFGGALGGLMGGLAKSGLVPTDTAEGKLLATQAELADLQKQEAEIYTEIGRIAYAQNPSGYPQSAKLALIQANIEQTTQELNSAKQAKEQEEAQKNAQTAAVTCTQCGHVNPEGTKFCQECGGKLGVSAKTFCSTCGAQLETGTRFCGACGARQYIE
ncbi:MAG: zinc ribbon domain-containing protein [Clostridium sp.]|jgi:RNA polymerase subunit RPABC4/transcription elongation factor Spt4|nr:zinc ribbon domain-containing protein [Clostridium sp.]